MPFGEIVMVRVVVDPAFRTKLDSQWHRGFWIGKSEGTDEHLIMTPAGIIGGRSARRLPEAERFDKAFLGLTGKEAEIKKVAQQYKVFFQKVIDGSSYTVDHSSGIYLIGKDGRVRIRHPYGSPPNLIAEDILKLI